MSCALLSSMPVSADTMDLASALRVLVQAAPSKFTAIRLGKDPVYTDDYDTSVAISGVDQHRGCLFSDEGQISVNCDLFGGGGIENQTDGAKAELIYREAKAQLAATAAASNAKLQESYDPILHENVADYFLPSNTATGRTGQITVMLTFSDHHATPPSPDPSHFGDRHFFHVDLDVIFDPGP
jgi:hypothetical protein